MSGWSMTIRYTNGENAFSCAAVRISPVPKSVKYVQMTYEIYDDALHFAMIKRISAQTRTRYDELKRGVKQLKR